MTDLIPSPYRGLFTSPSFAPREQFSVSQVEKACGSAHEPERGCLRSWAYRYLAGLKEPEYTYAEACALPEETPELKKFKGGVMKKTYGKVFHSLAEAYYRGEQLDLSSDAANRFFSGSHLAPHPSQCRVIEIEKPIRVRTGPEGGTITWSGFKDLVVQLPDSPRYLFDWKTTTPTVDNRRNRDAGKPVGSWTWQKDEKAIRIDYQANLYAYDELVNYGALPRGRWIYFANSGRPDARATDYEPELPLVLETVKQLDAHARVLRDMIRQYRAERLPGWSIEQAVGQASQVEPNLANCQAFGGCPYRSSVGGPCTAEQSGVIPVGSLLRTQTRPIVKPRDMHPGFEYVIPHTEREHHMGLAEDIANAKAARAGQTAPVQPTNGFAPAGPPPVAAPAWGGPPVATSPIPAVAQASAPPAFDPSFAFGAAPAVAAPAPTPAPAAPPPPAYSPHPARGTATQNPEWVCDGSGGYVPKRDYDAQQAAPAAPPGPPAPPAQETFPSHVNPPEAANPNLPAEAPKRGRGRPKTVTTSGPTPASEPLTGPVTIAPADFSETEITVTLKIGRTIVTVPAPADLADALQAYVLKAVGA